MDISVDFTAGLPQLDIHTLSEDWALATSLQNHWELLAQDMGLRPSAWIDSRGDRMYGAVMALRTEFLLSDPLREDEVFQARTRIQAIRKPHSISRTDFIVDGVTKASVDLVTSFVKRARHGSNKKFSSVRDIWKSDDLWPADVEHQLECHHAFKGMSAQELTVQMRYEVNRIQDFNTADFMYFKNFVRIAKAAEWYANRDQPTRLTRKRACYFYRNVEDGDIVTAHVGRQGDQTTTILTDSDDQRIFVSLAETPEVAVKAR